MPIDVVVGGQGGDEGKGAITAYLALNGDYDINMRVPAPQAGHSIYFNGKRFGLANLPSGLANPNLRLLIGRGGLISLERLLYGETRIIEGKEIKIPPEIPTSGITSKRLGIDYATRVVTLEHRKSEQENKHLMKNIGSVGSGTSACRIDEILRNPELRMAKHYPGLASYLIDTKREAFYVLEKNGGVLLEGDHGAKLDLVHGEYPFVTTRTVNAQGFLSEAGLPLTEVRDIYIILKPYTTRVGPGPLEQEIKDENVLNWAHSTGGETGTVSQRLRRIGKFEWDNVLETIKINGATKLVFTHLDCPDYVWEVLGHKNEKDFLEKVKKELCGKWPFPNIALLSYGPEQKDIVSY